jgi:hypothetical protein
MKTLQTLLVLSLVSLFAAGALFAQTQAINGSIRGHVTDPGGASVPQAKVTVSNAENGYTRAADTGDEGYFVFPNLPLGTYTVTISKTGFDTLKQTGVVLNAGTEGVIDAQLKVGAVTTTVEVTGGAPLIEPSRVNTGRTISHDEMDNAPLPSRNPYNFILFQPGVSGHPNPELGIPRTINTNGLLDRINYQMDGMVDTETDRHGLRLFPISEIYVREVQTVSNSFAPEFGNTSGDIYNVITNSGSNQFHGEFLFVGRPTNAFARPILLRSNTPAPIIDEHDYNVNSGGPIKKDKLFIFGGYEHLLRGLPVANTIDPTNAAQIGLSPSLVVTAPAVQHVQFLNLRADWIINDKNQLFVRYNYFRNEYPFNTAVGGLNALDVGADFRDRAHIAGLQLITSFSGNLQNELRASEPYRNETHIPNALDGPGPQVVISGILTFNGSSATGDRFAEKIPSVSDSVTYVHRAHTYKFGFGFQENNDNQIGNVFSRYTFSNIANYLLAKNGTNPLSYSTFVTVLGVPGLSYKSHFYDLYVQDSWQIKPNFLLIYGVRWDRYQAPGGEANAPFAYTHSFRTPGGNFAPRLGFAWQVRPKFVVRVNSGIFYEAPPTNLWFNALNNDGSPRSFQQSFGPTAAGAPKFPAVFNLLPGATPVTPSITAVTPNYKNAYTINSSIQLERELTPNDSVKVGYVHTAARNMEYLHNMNLINPTGTLADGRPIFASSVSAATRLFPQFNNITLQDIGAISDYNALLVSYQHRISQGFLVQASYTWSHSISDAPDVNSFEQNLSVEDPTNRRRDRGNSIVNRPQALLVSTVIQPKVKLDHRWANALANGNLLSLLATLSSGDQQNITTSTALNGDTVAVQRPLYIGRNTVRTPNIYQFDARYTRTIFSYRERIQAKVLAESINLFNHKNVTSLNTTATVNSLGVITSAPTLAPVSSVLDSRVLQLGIRLDW